MWVLIAGAQTDDNVKTPKKEKKRPKREKKEGVPPPTHGIAIQLPCLVPLTPMNSFIFQVNCTAESVAKKKSANSAPSDHSVEECDIILRNGGIVDGGASIVDEPELSALQKLVGLWASDSMTRRYERLDTDFFVSPLPHPDTVLLATQAGETKGQCCGVRYRRRNRQDR